MAIYDHFSLATDTDPARIREVDRENERLKRILDEQELEIAIPRDLLKKGNQPLPRS